MPYIIDEYEYIAKRMAELKKEDSGYDAVTEQVDDTDEDVLIVGYSGDFF